MPLTDFVRYLNAQLPPSTSELRSTARFFSDSGRVFVDYADLRLGSEFSAIVATASGELRGHAARLRVVRRRDGHGLAAQDLFALPETARQSDQEIVFVDRLVRTLHTLNYLTYRARQSPGDLLLKVHPHHVASVPGDHGLAFEEILRACRLLPQQITLELQIPAAGASAELAHWLRASANYQARGYRIALKHFAGQESDFALVERLAPALVRLDARLAATPAAREAIARLHALGSRVLGCAAANERARAAAWQDGIDYLQHAVARDAAQRAAPDARQPGDSLAWSAAA